MHTHTYWVRGAWDACMPQLILYNVFCLPMTPFHYQATLQSDSDSLIYSAHPVASNLPYKKLWLLIARQSQTYNVIHTYTQIQFKGNFSGSGLWLSHTHCSPNKSPILYPTSYNALFYILHHLLTTNVITIFPQLQVCIKYSWSMLITVI